MATSGSTSVTVTSWDTLKFSWSQSGQSIANNTTTISWKLELIATGSGRISASASKAWSVTVNGTNYSGTNNVSISNNSTKTLASGSTTITHNSDGTKTFSYSFSQQFAITFSGSNIGTKSGSGSGTLNTIPRKSTLSVGNGTLGTAQTLTVTRKSTSFTHTITYTCGSASGTVCTKSSNASISFTPPISLSSQNTTGTSVSIKYTITTYSGNTDVGSNSYTKTCSIPASVKPSCTITVTDSTEYSNIYGNPVQGLSRFKVVVNPTTSYGSPIATYKTTINGITYTSSSFTTGELNFSGSVQISTSVSDKRGRSSSAATVTKNVLNYVQPSVVKLTVMRCDEDGSANDKGEHTQVLFSSTVTSLNNRNTATYTLRYKKTTESTYTEITLDNYANMYSIVDGSYIFPSDSGSSYNVEISVSDAHKTVTRTTTVSTGFTLMHWNNSGNGMGIGKVSELQNVLDIGLQTRFYGGILHPILEAETDLNDIRTPNTYVGANTTNYKYVNCPLTDGTFTLEVVGSGADGQVKQSIQTCSKTSSKTYERYYYQGSWGDWICVSDFDGALLWEGAYFMHDTQEIFLSEAILKQRTGIVLVFSRYSGGTVQNYHFSYHFVPKMMVSKHGGAGSVFYMGAVEGDYLAAKYLYISDKKDTDGQIKGYIKGNDYNDNVVTGDNGITYTNNATVLRYVIGV